MDETPDAQLFFMESERERERLADSNTIYCGAGCCACEGAGRNETGDEVVRESVFQEPLCGPSSVLGVST